VSTIVGIRATLFELPLPAPFRPAWGRGRVQDAIDLVLIEVASDDGLVGYGAAHGGIESAIAIDRFIAPHLLGADLTKIERLAVAFREADILGPPLYGMEIPLWDLLGKMSGLPVYRLWGGATSRVRAYCATGELRTPQARADDACRLVEEGFTAIKLRLHADDHRDDLLVAETVRAAVGERIALMADANQAGVDPGIGGHATWTFQTALTVARELERLDFAWLEEPLPRHDHNGLRRLRDRLETLRLAGGEDDHGLHALRALLDHGCFDILQPDALKTETASAIRKLAAFAELTGVDVVPHTWGSGISLLVHLHLAASLTNCDYLEFPHDPPSGFVAGARDQMLSETVTVASDGFVEVPERPGFGFQIDHERLSRHTVSVFSHGDREALEADRSEL